MAQYFTLQLDTQGPINGSITHLDYYKDNTTPIQLAVTGATHMKIWINQSANGAKTDPEYPTTWSPYSATWTPNFSVEGTNYIHVLFADAVRNEYITGVLNSNPIVFDKTAPTVTAVLIANGADVVTTQNVVVRVTANDLKTGITDVSGIQKCTISGDLALDSDTEFLWSNTDRTNGYKDCVVKLSANTDPSHRESKTVFATATDRANNTSERGQDNIVLYTGGIDPVLVLKTPTNQVIGKHYGEKAVKVQMQVLTGISSLIDSYKIWGDIGDTSSTIDPTPEPSTWTTWTSGAQSISEDKYLTAVDGTKTVYGAVKLVVNSIADTVATHADLTNVTGQNDGDVYKVTTDETQSNKTTSYRWNATATEWQYYGELIDSDQYATHNIEIVTVHHSEAEPTIVLTSAESVISDKTGHDNTDLTATMTTSCNIYEYKVVAYASAADATAGTEADVTNVELSGTTEIPSGGTWTPNLLESKLKLAVSGEGQKFLVVYAKNLCDKWGKSNTLTITVDETAPTASITVNQYYKENSGFTASATDSVCAVSKMQAWVDSSAASETPPQTSTEYDYSANPTAAQVEWTGKINGTCYVHIKYTDEVGNYRTVHSNSFIYDDVAPIECSVSGPVLTNTPTVTLTLSASDVTSGMGMMKIYGDISGAATAEAAEWIAYSTSASITLSNGDGNKTVNVLFKDNAGNSITTAVSCVIELDTEGQTPTIVLYKNDESAILGNYTNVTSFKAHIGVALATDLPNIAKYKVWSDITEAATEEAATWKTFTPGTGLDYMSVGLTLTTGDGLKTVNVRIQDKAGNTGSAASATVTLDTVAPILDVNGVDYNVISKIHKPRLASSSEPITDTYADKMTFKFSSDSKLLQWKVCVNETGQQASCAVEIGTSGGSINMTGTNLAANTEVTCTIMGADLAANAIVADTDGAYEIIVYGEDEAHNWSAVHSI